jgi:hypothetical protein
MRSESAATAVPTARELRAELAAERLYRYTIAPIVGMNAQRLGQMLSETIPMPDDVARRIAGAIAKAKRAARV